MTMLLKAYCKKAMEMKIIVMIMFSIIVLIILVFLIRQMGSDSNRTIDLIGGLF